MGEQEERVVRSRVSHACPERTIETLAWRAGLCGQGRLLVGCARSEAQSESHELFAEQFPGAAAPTRWWSAPVDHCLDLRLDALRGSRTVVRDGRCVLSYEHLRTDYLPRAVRRFVETDTDNVTRSHKRPWRDDEDEQRECVLTRVGEEIAAEIGRHNGGGGNGGGGTGDAALAPIEECADARLLLLPPCAFACARELHQTQHLHWPERQQYAAFLLDAGWTEDAVTEHLRTHFMRGGTSAQQFDAKYATVAKRRGDGPFGKACATLVAHAVPTGEGRCAGCPFRWMARDRLRELLLAYGGAVADAADELAGTRARAPQAACARLFELQHGARPKYARSSPKPWPHSPHGFFGAARRARRRPSVE